MPVLGTSPIVKRNHFNANMAPFIFILIASELQIDLSTWLKEAISADPLIPNQKAKAIIVP
jgi:hypothetical protein